MHVIKQKLMLLLDKKTLGNLVKYLVIGGSAFIIEYLMFLVLRLFMHYIIANAIIYTVMFWIVFLANKFLNFKSQGLFLKQLAKYTALYVINFIVTNAMLFSLSEFLRVDPAISKILVSGSAVMWNFLLYKFVIYKE